MKKIISLIIFLIAYGSLSDFSYAQHMNQGWERCQPTYGEYCCGPRWGWYGAKRVVRTPVEAREILVRFFAPYSYIQVGSIRERVSFFEAEIIDSDGVTIDLVIIDKRTGRIRSIY